MKGFTKFKNILNEFVSTSLGQMSGLVNVEMQIRFAERRNYMTANQVNYLRLREDRRHNVVSEGETGRHNVATESIQRGQLGLGFQNLAELARHNTAQEGIDTERVRLGFVQAGEAERHNRAQESTALYDAFGRVIASNRQAGAAEKRATTESAAQRETARHNSAMESLTERGQDVQAETQRRGQDIQAGVEVSGQNKQLINGLIRSFVPVIFERSSQNGKKK